uniref:WXG100-like domain-containing protein n=1 Tax=Nocardia lijiangensis TaxID=299618 RepID=UPI000B231400
MSVPDAIAKSDIQLPEELHWLSFVAGGEWPDGSENGMFALADAWSDAAGELSALVTGVEDAIKDVLAAYPSADELNSQMVQTLKSLIEESDNASLQAIAKSMTQLSKSCDKVGCAIQENKIMIIIGLVQLVWEIALAWLSPVTAPAQQVVLISWYQMVFQWLKHTMMQMVIAALNAMGQQVILNILLQLGQMAAGHRENFDGKSLGQYALGGALGGAFGSLFGKIGADLFKFAGGKITRSEFDKRWQQLLTGMVQGGAGGVGGMVGGGVANQIINGGPFELDPRMLGAGAAGAFAGGARGWRNSGASPHIDAPKTGDLTTVLPPAHAPVGTGDGPPGKPSSSDQLSSGKPPSDGQSGAPSSHDGASGTKPGSQDGSSVNSNGSSSAADTSGNRSAANEGSAHAAANDDGSVPAPKNDGASQVSAGDRDSSSPRGDRTEGGDSRSNISTDRPESSTTSTSQDHRQPVDQSVQSQGPAAVSAQNGAGQNAAGQNGAGHQGATPKADAASSAAPQPKVEQPAAKPAQGATPQTSQGSSSTTGGATPPRSGALSGSGDHVPGVQTKQFDTAASQSGNRSAAASDQHVQSVAPQPKTGTPDPQTTVPRPKSVAGQSVGGDRTPSVSDKTPSTGDKTAPVEESTRNTSDTNAPLSNAAGRRDGNDSSSTASRSSRGGGDDSSSTTSRSSGRGGDDSSTTSGSRSGKSSDSLTEPGVAAQSSVRWRRVDPSLLGPVWPGGESFLRQILGFQQTIELFKGNKSPHEGREPFRQHVGSDLPLRSGFGQKPPSGDQDGADGGKSVRGYDEPLSRGMYRLTEDERAEHRFTVSDDGHWTKDPSAPAPKSKDSGDSSSGSGKLKAESGDSSKSEESPAQGKPGKNVVGEDGPTTIGVPRRGPLLNRWAESQAPVMRTVVGDHHGRWYVSELPHEAFHNAGVYVAFKARFEDGKLTAVFDWAGSYHPAPARVKAALGDLYAGLDHFDQHGRKYTPDEQDGWPPAAEPTPHAKKPAAEDDDSSKTEDSELRAAYEKAVQDDQPARDNVDKLIADAGKVGGEKWDAYEAKAFEQAADKRYQAVKAAAEALREHYQTLAGPDGSGPLAKLSGADLAELIKNGSETDSRVALMELIRRGTGGAAGGPGGKVLRPTQLATEMLLERGPVEMDTGEGKELTVIARATRSAMKNDIIHVMTSSDPLVLHMQHEFLNLVAGEKHGLDIEVRRMDSDAPFEPPREGKKLIVVGTAQDYGFRVVKEAQTMIDKLKASGMSDARVAELKAALEEASTLHKYKQVLDDAADEVGSDARFEPFRRGEVIIDEMDDQLVDVQSQYVLTPFAAKDADSENNGFDEYKRQAEDTWNSFREAVEKQILRPEHFGKDPDHRGIFDSRLSPEGKAELEAHLNKKLTDEEEAEYAHAAQAWWGPERASDYHVSEKGDGTPGKIKIISSATNDQLLDDPEKQSSSRWSGFAKYLELKEGLEVASDSKHSISVTGRQLFSYFSRLTGTSGTLLTSSEGNPRGVERVLHEEHETGPITRVERYFKSQLELGDAKYFGSKDEKFSAMADDILDTAFVERDGQWRQEGRPQLVVAMDNVDVARLAQALRDAAGARNLEVAFDTIDVAWVDRHNDKGLAYRNLTELTDAAGGLGKILIGNKLLGRGTDITPVKAAIENGGLQVKISGGPAYSERVNHQVENRTARSGDPTKGWEDGGTPGEARHYISPEDFRSRAPHKNVKVIVTRYEQASAEYKDASEAHKRDQSTENKAKLDNAGSELKAAEDQLRNIATPQQKAAVEQHILSSRNPGVYSANAPPLTGSTSQPDSPPPIPTPRASASSDSTERAADSSNEAAAPPTTPRARTYPSWDDERISRLLGENPTPLTARAFGKSSSVQAAVMVLGDEEQARFIWTPGDGVLDLAGAGAAAEWSSGTLDDLTRLFEQEGMTRALFTDRIPESSSSPDSRTRAAASDHTEPARHGAGPVNDSANPGHPSSAGRAGAVAYGFTTPSDPVQASRRIDSTSKAGDRSPSANPAVGTRTAPNRALLDIEFAARWLLSDRADDSLDATEWKEMVEHYGSGSVDDRMSSLARLMGVPDEQPFTADTMPSDWNAVVRPGVRLVYRAADGHVTAISVGTNEVLWYDPTTGDVPDAMGFHMAVRLLEENGPTHLVVDSRHASVTDDHLSQRDQPIRQALGADDMTSVPQPMPPDWLPVPGVTDPLCTALAVTFNLGNSPALRIAVARRLEENFQYYRQRFIPEQLNVSWAHESSRRQTYDATYSADPAGIPLEEQGIRQNYDNWYWQQVDDRLHRAIVNLRDFRIDFDSRHVPEGGLTKQELLTLAGALFRANLILHEPNRAAISSLEDHYYNPTLQLRQSPSGHYEIGLNADGSLWAAVHPIEPAAAPIPGAILPEQIPPAFDRVLASRQVPLLDGAVLGRHYTGENRPLRYLTTLDLDESTVIDRSRLEIRSGMVNTPTHYMTPEEREQHRLFVGPDGRLYQARDGAPFRTAGSKFVMDEFGNLYSGETSVVSFHSSFLGGRTVTAAGYLVVDDGRVRVMTDHSGHYHPNPQVNDYAFDLLRRQGLVPASNFQRKEYDPTIPPTGLLGPVRERVGELERQTAETARLRRWLHARDRVLRGREQSPDNGQVRQQLRAERRRLAEQQKDLGNWDQLLTTGQVRPSHRLDLWAHPDPVDENDRIVPPGFPAEVGADGTAPMRPDQAQKLATWWNEHGRQWWSSLHFADLSPEYQRRLTIDFPRLRNSDEIPLAVRNALNRAYLEAELRTSATDSASPRGQYAMGTLIKLADAELEARLDAIRAGTAAAPVHMLKFDPDEFSDSVFHVEAIPLANEAQPVPADVREGASATDVPVQAAAGQQATPGRRTRDVVGDFVGMALRRRRPATSPTAIQPTGWWRGHSGRAREFLRRFGRNEAVRVGNPSVAEYRVPTPVSERSQSRPEQAGGSVFRGGVDEAEVAGTLNPVVEGVSAPEGGVWKSMPGEGNCLFHALAELLPRDHRGDPITHEELRPQVVEALYQRAAGEWDGFFDGFMNGEPEQRRRSEFQRQLEDLLLDGRFRDDAAELFLPYAVRQLGLNVDIARPSGVTTPLRHGLNGPVYTLLRATGDGDGHYHVAVDGNGVVLGEPDPGHVDTDGVRRFDTNEDGGAYRAGGQSQSTGRTAASANGGPETERTIGSVRERARRLLQRHRSEVDPNDTQRDQLQGSGWDIAPQARPESMRNALARALSQPFFYAVDGANSWLPPMRQHEFAEYLARLRAARPDAGALDRFASLLGVTVRVLTHQGTVSEHGDIDPAISRRVVTIVEVGEGRYVPARQGARPTYLQSHGHRLAESGPPPEYGTRVLPVPEQTREVYLYRAADDRLTIGPEIPENTEVLARSGPAQSLSWLIGGESVVSNFAEMNDAQWDGLIELMLEQHAAELTPEGHVAADRFDRWATFAVGMLGRQGFRDLAVVRLPQELSPEFLTDRIRADRRLWIAGGGNAIAAIASWRGDELRFSVFDPRESRTPMQMSSAEVIQHLAGRGFDSVVAAPFEPEHVLLTEQQRNLLRDTEFRLIDAPAVPLIDEELLAATIDGRSTIHVLERDGLIRVYARNEVMWTSVEAGGFDFPETIYVESDRPDQYLRTQRIDVDQLPIADPAHVPANDGARDDRLMEVATLDGARRKVWLVQPRERANELYLYRDGDRGLTVAAQVPAGSEILARSSDTWALASLIGHRHLIGPFDRLGERQSALIGLMVDQHTAPHSVAGRTAVARSFMDRAGYRTETEFRTRQAFLTALEAGHFDGVRQLWIARGGHAVTAVISNRSRTFHVFHHDSPDSSAAPDSPREMTRGDFVTFLATTELYRVLVAESRLSPVQHSILSDAGLLLTGAADGAGLAVPHSRIRELAAAGFQVRVIGRSGIVDNHAAGSILQGRIPAGHALNYRDGDVVLVMLATGNYLLAHPPSGLPPAYDTDRGGLLPGILPPVEVPRHDAETTLTVSVSMLDESPSQVRVSWSQQRPYAQAFLYVASDSPFVVAPEVPADADPVAASDNVLTLTWLTDQGLRPFVPGFFQQDSRSQAALIRLMYAQWEAGEDQVRFATEHLAQAGFPILAVHQSRRRFWAGVVSVAERRRYWISNGDHVIGAIGGRRHDGRVEFNVYDSRTPGWGTVMDSTTFDRYLAEEGFDTFIAASLRPTPWPAESTGPQRRVLDQLGLLASEPRSGSSAQLQAVRRAAAADPEFPARIRGVLDRLNGRIAARWDSAELAQRTGIRLRAVHPDGSSTIDGESGPEVTVLIGWDRSLRAAVPALGSEALTNYVRAMGLRVVDVPADEDGFFRAAVHAGGLLLSHGAERDDATAAELLRDRLAQQFAGGSQRFDILSVAEDLRTRGSWAEPMAEIAPQLLADVSGASVRVASDGAAEGVREQWFFPQQSTADTPTITLLHHGGSAYQATVPEFAHRPPAATVPPSERTLTPTQESYLAQWSYRLDPSDAGSRTVAGAVIRALGARVHEWYRDEQTLIEYLWRQRPLQLLPFERDDLGAAELIRLDADLVQRSMGVQVTIVDSDSVHTTSSDEQSSAPQRVVLARTVDHRLIVADEITDPVPEWVPRVVAPTEPAYPTEQQLAVLDEGTTVSDPLPFLPMRAAILRAASPDGAVSPEFLRALANEFALPAGEDQSQWFARRTDPAAFAQWAGIRVRVIAEDGSERTHGPEGLTRLTVLAGRGGIVRVALPTRLSDAQSNFVADRQMFAIDVSNDGDCFFQAAIQAGGGWLSRTVGYEGVDAVDQLRDRLSRRLHYGIDRYRSFLTAPTEQHISELVAGLSTRGHWASEAGDLAPRLLADSTGAVVVVVPETGQPQEFVPENRDPAAPIIHLMRVDGNHYQYAAVPNARASVPGSPSLTAGADESTVAGAVNVQVEGVWAPVGGAWKSMPGEGNCLFHALAELLSTNDRALHEDLRAEVVAGLRAKAAREWDDSFGDFLPGVHEDIRQEVFQRQLDTLLEGGRFMDPVAEQFLPFFVRELGLNVDIDDPTGVTTHLHYGPGLPVYTLLRATGDGRGHFHVAVDENGVVLNRPLPEASRAGAWLEPTEHRGPDLEDGPLRAVNGWGPGYFEVHPSGGEPWIDDELVNLFSESDIQEAGIRSAGSVAVAAAPVAGSADAGSPAAAVLRPEWAPATEPPDQPAVMPAAAVHGISGEYLLVPVVGDDRFVAFDEGSSCRVVIDSDGRYIIDEPSDELVVLERDLVEKYFVRAAADDGTVTMNPRVLGRIYRDLRGELLWLAPGVAAARRTGDAAVIEVYHAAERRWQRMASQPLPLRAEPITGPLWPLGENGELLPPRPADFAQGGLGTCYQIANFVAMVHSYPHLLDRLIRWHPEDNTYSVLFFAGDWELWIRVDNVFYVDRDGELLYAGGRSKPLAIAVWEKAWAAFQGGAFGYAGVIGGDPAMAATSLLPRTAPGWRAPQSRRGTSELILADPTLLDRDTLAELLTSDGAPGDGLAQLILEWSPHDWPDDPIVDSHRDNGRADFVNFVHFVLLPEVRWQIGEQMRIAASSPAHLAEMDRHELVELFGSTGLAQVIEDLRPIIEQQRGAHNPAFDMSDPLAFSGFVHGHLKRALDRMQTHLRQWDSGDPLSDTRVAEWLAGRCHELRSRGDLVVLGTRTRADGSEEHPRTGLAHNHSYALDHVQWESGRATGVQVRDPHRPAELIFVPLSELHQFNWLNTFGVGSGWVFGSGESSHFSAATSRSETAAAGHEGRGMNAHAERGRPAPPEPRPSSFVSEYTLVTPHSAESIAAMSAEERLRSGPFATRDMWNVEKGQVSDDGTALSFPRFRVARPVVVDQHPMLRVSGDGSIALTQASRFAKDFYAIPEVVEQASKALAQAGSNMRLTLDEETYVEFVHNGQKKRLLRVTPAFRTRPTDVCRDFSEQVLGGSHTHMVLFDTRSEALGGTGAVAIAPIDIKSGREVAGTHHLAEYLVRAADDPELDSVIPESAVIAVSRADDEPESAWPAPGQSYRSAGDPFVNRQRNQALEAAESALGVNAKAFAKPMEAYLRQSIASSQDSAGSRNIPGSYGYHFAPVVLESQDGQHQITIENLNIRSSHGKNLDDVLDLNLEYYRHRVDDLRTWLAAAGNDLGPGNPRFELIESMRKIRDAEERLAVSKATASISPVTDEMQRERASGALAAARGDAKRSLAAIFGKELGSGGDMWTFAMYGRARGESFFEVVDPTTDRIAVVLIADHGNQRRELEFAPGSAALDSLQLATLDRMAARLAKVVAWRQNEGMQLPHMDLTVESMPNEQELAAARGDVVERYFLGRLQTHLAELDRRFSAADLQVTLRRRERNSQRAGMIGDGATQVRSRVVLSYFTGVDPAEKVNLTGAELAQLARDIGVHRERGFAGHARAWYTGVRLPEIVRTDDIVRRTTDIVRAAQYLDGTTQPTIGRLTDIRRAADILIREYHHTGPFRLEHLDPLVCDVLGLAPYALVDNGQRNDLVELVRAAKMSHRPVTRADLDAARDRLLSRESLSLPASAAMSAAIQVAGPVADSRHASEVAPYAQVAAPAPVVARRHANSAAPHAPSSPGSVDETVGHSARALLSSLRQSRRAGRVFESVLPLDEATVALAELVHSYPSETRDAGHEAPSAVPQAAAQPQSEHAPHMMPGLADKVRKVLREDPTATEFVPRPEDVPRLVPGTRLWLFDERGRHYVVNVVGRSQRRAERDGDYSPRFHVISPAGNTRVLTSARFVGLLGRVVHGLIARPHSDTGRVGHNPVVARRDRELDATADPAGSNAVRLRG